MAHANAKSGLFQRALALSALVVAGAFLWQASHAQAQGAGRMLPMSKSLAAAKAIGVCAGPAVALSLSPGAIALPPAVNGGACTSAPFTITNVGNVTAGVGTISTTLSSVCDESNPFNAGAACSNISLAPLASCTGSVSLCASGNCTGARTGQLIVSTPTTGGTLTASLAGTISDPTPAAKPNFLASPTSIDFGPVLQGLNSATRTVTVTNGGTANLNVAAAVSPAAGPFSIVSDTCTGGPVAFPSGSCTVVLRYTATNPAIGAEGGSLTLTHNDPNPSSFQFSPFNVSLVGTGVAPPGLVLSSVDFGTVDYGSVWGSSATLTNASGGNVRPAGVSILQTGSPFSLGALDTCTAQLIPSGGSCTVDIVFTAPAGGTTSVITTHTLSMSIDTTPASTPTFVAVTSGLIAETIPPAPTISVSPVTPDGFGNLVFTFPNTVVGSPSACQNFTYTNTGPSAAVFLNSDPFSPFAPCTPAVGGPPACASLTDVNGHIVLGTGASCLVAYQFLPTSGFLQQDFNVGPYDPFRGSLFIARFVLEGQGTGALIGFNPPSLSFGSQVINTSAAPQVLTVSNAGTLPLTLFGLTAPAAPFAVVVDNCAPYPRVLVPAGSCTVSFGFSPTVITSFFGNAIFSSDSVLSFSPPPNNTFFSLDGDGVALPTPSADFFPMSLSFGNVAYNTNSVTQNFAFANTGSAPMTISSIAASGTNAGDFLLTHNCPLSPATLGINTCCTVNVTFHPTVGGTAPTPETAAIDITTNATPAVVSVPVDGISIPPPSITATPFSVTFPDTVINVSSPATKVILRNTGTTVVTLGNFVFTGNFALAPLGPTIPPATAPTPTSTCNPGPLAIGATCYIDVIFRPTALGPLTGALVLPFSNGVSSPTIVPLAGNGISPFSPAIGVSTDVVDFGSVLINQGSTRLVNVSSIGTSPLTVTGVRTLQPFFSASTDCGAGIPVGLSCTVTVRCLPTSLATQTGDLYIDHDASGAFRHVTLICTGVPLPIPKIEVSVTGVGFGNQSLGTPSAKQQVTIRSVGTTGLSLRNIGTHSPFAVTHDCPLVLPVGESCIANVAFSPSGAGPNSDQLAIASDDPVRPSVQVDLSGIGCRPYSVQAGRRGGSLCSP